MGQKKWQPNLLLLAKLEKTIRNSPDYATGRVAVGPKILTWEEVIIEVQKGTRFGRRYYQGFLEVSMNIMRSVCKEDKKETPSEVQVRKLADARCRRKHRDYYDSLICVGPKSGRGFRPPCDECIEEVRKEIRRKQRQTRK